MKRWYMNLVPRERMLVAGGAAVLLLMAAYVLVVEPLVERKAMLERQVVSQTVLLDWMQGVVDSIGATGARADVARQESLFALVDRTSRIRMPAGAVQRIQPEGQSTVRLWLENAPFDELVRWIGFLEREHGVVTSSFTVERSGDAGVVSARLTLERAQ